MRKSFEAYAEMRRDFDLANALVGLGVDTKEWVDQIIYVNEQHNLSLGELQEGMMGGLKSLGGAAMRGIGPAFNNVATGIKNWAQNQAINPAIQAGKAAWQAGSAKQDFDNAIKSIARLKGYLTQINGQEAANQFITNVTNQLVKAHQQMVAASAGSGVAPGAPTPGGAPATS